MMINKICGAFFAAVILLLNFFNSPVQAQSIYNISDVPVDVTAKDAATARQQAITQAQRTAFDILLSRMLINPQDRQGLATISAAELNSMIADFEITSERSSTVRYIANLSFRFRPEVTKKFLRDNQVDYVEVTRERTLFLPVLVFNDHEVLFEDNNPWLENWQKLLPKFSFLSPVLPVGDIDDLQLINHEDNKISFSSDGYQRFRDKYKVQHIWLVKLYRDNNESNVTKIEIFNFDSSNNTFILAEEIDLPRSSDSYGQLVTGSLLFLEEKWKNEHIINAATIQNIRLLARFNDQAGWYSIQEKLKRIQLIENLNIVKIGSKFVEMEVQLNGTIDKLTTSLRSYGLEINIVSQGIYQITIP